MLLYIFVACCQVGLLFYYFIFNKIKKREVTQTDLDRNIPISVIICAKNEEENLQKHIDSWLNQNHKNFELIIVNDASSDGSLEFLKKKSSSANNLVLLEIPQNKERLFKGKRTALKKGIEAAKNEFLLFSDADCKPISDDWVSYMANSFSEEKEIVLGYSPYKIKPTFLNSLIQYDTILTAFQYLGFAAIKHPYMGVGRNLAYKKSLISDDVFEKSNKSTSGDDDLIVSQFSKGSNTTFQINEKSFMESIPVENYIDLLNQKSRHLEAGWHYSFNWKLILGVFYFLNVLQLLFLSFIVFFKSWEIGLLLYLLRIFLICFCLYKPFKRLNSKHLLARLLIIDLVYWVNSIIIHIFRTFNKSNKFRRSKSLEKIRR